MIYIVGKAHYKISLPTVPHYSISQRVEGRVVGWQQPAQKPMKHRTGARAEKKG